MTYEAGRLIVALGHDVVGLERLVRNGLPRLLGPHVNLSIGARARVPPAYE